MTHVRTRVGAAVAAILALGAVVLVPTAAQAAPGDASATGVSINLNASVRLGIVTIPLVGVTGVVGSAVAPPGGGTSSTGVLGVGLGGLGVTTSGSVADVRATRTAAGSSASSQIAGVDIGVLGISAVRTGAVTAQAVCSAGAPATASAEVLGLSLLGQAVTLDAATPTVTTSAGVSILGLEGATLTATARRVVQTTATTASAAAVSVELRLTALGIAAVNLGSIELATAQCQAPNATASSVTPSSGPTSGGTSVTVTGNGLQSTTGVTFGGVPATSFTVSPDGTTLTAVAPASETPGAVGVVLARPTGNLTAGTFTYVPPAVASVDPPQGSTVGGTTVTITGTGLGAATGATFGGVPGTLVGSPTDTALQVRTPAGAVGPVPVVVVLPGADATAADAFTYVAPTAPTVSAVTPAQGPAAGGTEVTFTGTNLATVTDVTFDGLPATVVGTPTATSLTVTTPAHPAGPVEVALTNPGGTTVAPDPFTYLEDGSAATFTGVTPASVLTSGGTTITVTGTGLAGATGVTVGGVVATDVVAGPDAVTATVPAAEAAGTAEVVVQFPAGQRPAGTVTLVAPTITGVAPAAAPAAGGTAVTVTGTGLAATTAVTFGGEPGTVVAAAPDGTSLTVTVPAHAPGTVDVVATLPGADVTLADGFTYEDDGTGASVADLTPATAPTSGGTTLTVTGAGLGGVTGVTVGGATAGDLDDAADGTRLTVTLPAAPAGGPVPVVLQFPAGTLPAGEVTYVAPVVTDVAPAQGPQAGGTRVTVTGTGLDAATGVLFDGAAGTDLVVGDGTVTVTAPPHAPGPVDVVVVLPGADAVAADGFAYLAPDAAVVTGVAPDEGPTSGGTTVTLTGSGLGSVASVLFDGVPGTGLTVVDDDTVRVVTPAHAPGPVTLTVTNAGGESWLPDGFTYLADGTGATVTGTSPAAVPTSGGTQLVVTGTGLTGATSLTVGGVAATDVTVSPDGTTLTAVTGPSAVAGDQPVVVGFPLGELPAGTVTYVAPALTALLPAEGPAAGGTTVQVTGTGIDAATRVTFDGVAAADLTVAAPGVLTVTAPAHAPGEVAVVVEVPGLDPAPLTFTYLDDGSGADVTGLSPAQLPTSGGAVTLTGTGLAGATGVTVGGLPVADLAVEDDRITFTAPAVEGAGDAPVVVTFPVGTVEAGDLTYVAPTVVQVSPTFGTTSGGNPVTITGTGLAAATGVDFGGVVVTGVADPSGTSVDVVAPPHAPGAVDVTVLLPGSDATLPAAYTFLEDGAGAVVDAVEPATVPTAGGTTVTVRGAGLSAVTAVTVGGVLATDVVPAADGSSVTFVVPAAEAGGSATVSLRFPAGTVVAGSVTYVAPALTGVTPAEGPIAGGTSVTLTGTGLTGQERVLVGGAPAEVTAAAPDGTSLTVTTAPNVPGAADVVVVLPGADAVLPAGFTYLDDGTQADVADLTPATSPTSGGGTLTVTGTGLGAVTGVTVGGVAAADLDVAADGTSVSVTVPAAEAAGDAPVVLTFPAGEVVAGELAYVAPALTSASPATGPVAGGTEVVLTGTGLAAVTGVTFGGTPATVLDAADDGTSVTVEAPLGAPGTVDVVVALPGADAVLAGGFTYLPDGTGAAVTGLEPAQLPTSGGTLTVVGSGLEGATGVTVGGVATTDLVVAPDGTSLTVTVAASESAGAVPVVVTFPVGSIPAGSLTLVAPAVTGVAPAQGPSGGGTDVTLTGTGLAGATAVTFGGTPGTGLAVAPDGGSLTVTAPAGSAGAVDVVVVLPGADALVADGFTYLEDGTGVEVTDLAPATSPTAGGGTGTVTGTGLGAVTGVTVGGTPAAVTAVTGTEVTFTVPASETAGDAEVVLELPAGTVVAGTIAYEASTVADVDPAQGPQAGGTEVTVTGTDLGSVTEVLVGGAAATGVTATGTTVSFTTPAGTPGAVDVVLGQPGADVVLPGVFTYLVDGSTATVGTLDPASGPLAGGTVVTLPGTGLTGATGVTVDGVAATGVTVTGTSLTFTTPAGTEAGAAAVVVVFPAGTVAAGSFEYVDDGSRTEVTDLTPATSPTAGGAEGTVTGTGLGAVTGVTVGGTPAVVTAVTATEVAFTVPASETAGDAEVVLQLPAGTVGAGTLTYAASTATDVAPAEGPQSGGTEVTVTGTDLGSVTEVLVGGAAATGVTATGTTVSFTTPAGTPGAVDVVLGQPGADVVLPGAFTYLADGTAATVSGVAPAELPTSGGTVAVSGTGLGPVTAVTVGGVAATDVVVAADGSSVSFTVPPSVTAGPVDVVLTFPAGTLPAGSVTLVEPTVTGVSPGEGPAGGGTLVTVTGTGLGAATDVRFDGVPGAGPVAAADGTSLTVTTPAGAAGAADVAVVLPGLDATLPDGFTYLEDGTGAEVDGLTPTTSPTAGGGTATVTGTGLADVTGVTVGGAPAVVTGVTATEVTFTVPAAEAAGDVAVVLQLPAGTVLAGELTYVASTVTDVDPAQGPQAGGTEVTVTGTDLGAVTEVLVGGVAATRVSATGTSVTFTAPAGTPGAVDVVLGQPGADVVLAGGFTYLVDGSTATVGTLDPASGPLAGGTAVTLPGTGLTGATGVTVDGVTATGVTVTDTSITFTTPAGTEAGAAAVVVVFPAGTVAAGEFTFVDDGSLTEVTDLTPTTSPTAGGGTATVTGTGLGGVTGVTVRGTPVVVTGVTDTEVTFTIPASETADEVDVVLQLPAGTVAAGTITYAASTATDVEPAEGPQSGGTEVTVTGTDLASVVEVLVGGTPATDVTATDTEVTFTTPAGTPGPVDVLLGQPGADVVVTGGFTYLVDGSAATVGALDPASGPLAGGTVVTLPGTGLTGATGVTVDGVAATGVTVTGTSITFTTPAGTEAGAAAVVVVFPAGTVAAGEFTYVDDGSQTEVTDLTPTSSPTAGGAEGTVTGTGLGGVTGVTVGGTPAVVTAVSDTEVTFTIPASETAGDAEVVLQLPAGTVGAGTVTYAASTVTDLDPAEGTEAGGTTVTVTGTALGAVTEVLVGGTPATGVSATATTVTFTTPASTPGPVDVVLGQPGADVVLTGAFTYLPDGTGATVGALDPASGPLAGGTVVTLPGTNLAAATGVTVGGVAATGVTATDTSVTFTTPAGTGAGAAAVVVVFPAGTVAAGEFTYVDDGSRTEVTDLTPATSPTAGGAEGTVTGTGLGGVTGVTVGGTPAVVTAVSDTEVTFTIPASETAGDAEVVLQLPAGTVGAGTLTYAASTATDVAPAEGPQSGGTEVVVTGTDLASVTDVLVGGTPATGVTATGTTVTFTTPAGTPGPVDVVLGQPGADVVLPGAFTYLADGTAATVSGVAPAELPTSGGTVTVSGAGLGPVTGVTIGGVAADGVVVAPDGASVSFTVPPGAAGPVDVVLTFPAGTLPAGAVTRVAPTLTGVSPLEGPAGGGTLVTITGTGLRAATDVTFDGTPGAGLVVAPDGTSLTVTTPAGPAGPVDVTVVLPGPDAALPDGFTYLPDSTGAEVDDLTPTTSPTAGGGTATVTGTGLDAVTDVTVGGAPVDVTAVSGTEVTFTVPASETAGAVAVVLQLPTGTVLAGELTYVASTVTDVDPAQGPQAGGTEVTVTGTDLGSVADVLVGGTPATGVTATGTTVTFTTPAGTPGAVDVVLGQPGADVVLAGGFTYLVDGSTATVGTLDPASGPLAGGTVVTLPGTGLTGATGVTVDGVAATGVTVTGTSITFTTPAGTEAGAAAVVVVFPAGTVAAGEFTYVDDGSQTEVTDLTPATSPTAGGGTATVTGTGLAGVTGVTVGGTPAVVTAVSGTEVTFTIPASETAGDAEVVLQLPGGTVGAGTLAYEASTAADVEPAQGPQSGGTEVTVTGTDLGAVTEVLVGGAPATAVTATGTTVTFTTPAGTPGPVDVVLGQPGADVVLPGGFTHLVDGSAATVTGVSPESAPLAGGSPGVVAGTGLTGATGVTVGGVAATDVVVAPDGTSVMFTVPAGTEAGTAPVVVQFPAGTVDAGSVTYVDDGSRTEVTDLTPATSPTAGGGEGTVTGTGLAAVTGVTVGGTPAVVTAVTATEVAFTVPASETAGDAEVVLQLPAGTVGAGTITYEASTIAGLEPVEGPQSGGTEVVVTGTDLGAVTEVLVGGAPAGGVTATATTVTFTTPAGTPGPVDVVLGQPGADVVLTDGFTYLVDGSAATVTGLAPSTVGVAGGTTITVTGTGLTGATGVTVGGEPATDVVVSPDGTSLTAVVPAGTPGPATVTVVFPAGTLDAGDVTYVEDGSDAEVTSLAPATGPTSGGGTVTVTGTGLDAATGLTVGGVGAADLVVAADGTSVTATLPPSEVAGPVPVVVRFPAGTRDAGTFTYAAPDVAAVAPATGPEAGGTTVTITGSGLAAATGITFDGVAGTDLVVTADGLTVVTPPHAAGPVDVVVQLPGLDATETAGFGYLPPAGPYVEAVLPGRGPTTGGTRVDIRGLGLESTTLVTFDGIPAEIVGGPAPVGEVGAQAEQPTPTEVTVVTPPHPVGLVDVAITTAAGVTVLPDAFEYYEVAAPAQVRVLRVTPDEGPTSGGQTVTVYGTGFVAGSTSVTIGGIPVASLAVLSDEVLVFTTPQGPAGEWPLVVSVGGVSSAPVPYEFLETAAPVPPAPTVTSTSPATVPTGGGATVTVTGTGFVPGATSVLVCGTLLGPDAVAVSPDGTRLSFVAPACAAGTATLTVLTPGGTAAASLVYVAAPEAAAPGTGTGTGTSTGDGDRRSGGRLAATGTDGAAAWWAALLLLTGGALLLTRGLARRYGER